jgi:glycosyltransferase involved in cell wall biosynthesis
MTINALTFTTLYPNAAQENHGVFVENRILHLSRNAPVDVTVVAPVPWFPFNLRFLEQYAAFARAPYTETRHGIEVLHPRYPVIPKVGMTAAPFLLYRFSRPAVHTALSSGTTIDLIDAHYFYPDGVAAALLARHFRLPLCITARGTDINLIPSHPVARRLIRWAGRQADSLIAVCSALKEEMVRIGIDPSKITVLRNGVDLELFRPLDRNEARKSLDVGGPLVLSAGHLIPRKGHEYVIRALADVPNATLAIAGDGPLRSQLERIAQNLDLGSRVRFLGSIPHEQMPAIYSAADVLVLASDREGWANVLLEAMACGTPVVATRIWGTPEIVTAPEAGNLVPDREPETLARAIYQLLSNLPDRTHTRAFAERFSWQETTEGQHVIFQEMLERSSRQ